MTIGIDGNMWYVSNGLCLAEARAKFSFERTLKEALAAYNRDHVKDNESVKQCPANMQPFLSMTPEEYQQAGSKP